MVGIHYKRTLEPILSFILKSLEYGVQVMGYETEENGRKFMLDGDITAQNVKVNLLYFSKRNRLL